MACSACHVLDVPFVFDTLDPMAALLGNEPPRELARPCKKHGLRLRAPAIPGWPAWGEDSREVMRFHEVSERSVIRMGIGSPCGARCSPTF